MQYKAVNHARLRYFLRHTPKTKVDMIFVLDLTTERMLKEETDYNLSYDLVDNLLEYQDDYFTSLYNSDFNSAYRIAKKYWKL